MLFELWLTKLVKELYLSLITALTMRTKEFSWQNFCVFVYSCRAIKENVYSLIFPRKSFNQDEILAPDSLKQFYTQLLWRRKYFKTVVGVVTSKKRCKFTWQQKKNQWNIYMKRL